MITITGRYRFFPKPVAFRNDFCLRCDEQTIALSERTFDVLHFFWIPILPVGLWRRWFCSQCGYKPSHPPRTPEVRRRLGWRITTEAVDKRLCDRRPRPMGEPFGNAEGSAHRLRTPGLVFPRHSQSPG